ncbi:MAG: sigma-70 family RNA polymerase sigma factor [Aquihabitans sp.]
MMEPNGPEALVEAVRERLVGALTLATGRRAVAEELAQDALVRAWQRWPQVSAADDPEAWVFRVGFNLAASWGRRQSAEWRANRRSEAGSDPAGAHLDADAAEVLALRSAVAALPARQRAVVVARYYLGYDVASTAALLSIASGTVKATTSHALANLRAAGVVEDQAVTYRDEPEEVAR